jgi:methyl-accepting chemotaxis protein
MEAVSAIAEQTTEHAQRVTASTEEVTATVQGLSLFSEDIATVCDVLRASLPEAAGSTGREED